MVRLIPYEAEMFQRPVAAKAIFALSPKMISI